MATTIITKNGSGAPLAGDLQVGELAIDLTNKKLYSKEGTTVFEVGATGGGAAGTFTDLTATNSFTSVGIDDNATSTAITIDASENVGIGETTPVGILHLKSDDTGVVFQSSSGVNNRAQIFFQDSAGTQTAKISVDPDGGSANVMAFSTGTSERMRIDSSGNVGIGTDSPSNDLQVGDATDATEIINIASTGNGYLTFGDAADNDIGFLQYNHASNFMAFATNTAEAMRIDSSGRVGIGITTPSTASGNADNLVINENGNAGITIRTEAASGYSSIYFADSASVTVGRIEYQHGDDAMLFYTSGSERARITSSGNVGIGTTSPAAQLNLSSPNNIGGASGTFTNAALKIGTAATGMFFDTNEIHGGETLNFFSNGTDNSVADYIRFSTGGSAGSERMRIDSSGNVGIGETSPDARLEVAADGASNSFSPAIKVTEQGVDVYGGEIGARFVASNNKQGLYVEGYNSLTLKADSTAIDFIVGAGNAANDTDLKMRLDSSDRLLLGCTTSNGSFISSNHTQLNIQGNASGAIGSLMLRSKGTTNATTFELAASDGVAASYLWNGSNSAMVFGTNNAERVRITSGGDLLVGISSPASVTSVKQVIYNGGDQSCYLQMAGSSNSSGILMGTNNTGNCSWYSYTGAIGSETYGSATMTLDSSGNLLVGTTSALTNASRLQVSGTGGASTIGAYRATASATSTIAAFASDVGGTQVNTCLIKADGDLENTNNSYGAISDARLKSNIVDASPQLNDIMAVQVRSYTLDSTGDTHIGVVAQELEASGMSGLVQENEEGMKSVKYSVLYMKAIKALQEAVTRIETLEAEVAALKGA